MIPTIIDEAVEWQMSVVLLVKPSLQTHIFCMQIPFWHFPDIFEQSDTWPTKGNEPKLIKKW